MKIVNVLSALVLGTSVAALSSDPENSQKIPSDLKLGSRCTIIYARHGEKDGDKLTEQGHRQAEALSQSLLKFEQEYVLDFDSILHSDMNRSLQTARPFKLAKERIPEPPFEVQNLLRECEKSEARNGVCSQKAKRVLETIQKGYCGRAGASEPTTVFVTAHGLLGMFIFREISKRLFVLDFAEPYVLTSDDGVSFRMIYTP